MKQRDLTIANWQFFSDNHLATNQTAILKTKIAQVAFTEIFVRFYMNPADKNATTINITPSL
jgi:hypothetical protein